MAMLQLTMVFLASVGAGMLNSVAGGGTLLTFPALIWGGMPPIVANATNAMALVPGGLSSIYAYRQQLESTQRRYFVLALPSLLGGGAGAVLLRLTPPPTFEMLVPLLIAFATILFTIQGRVQRWLRSDERAHHPVTRRWLLGASLYQLLVATYGGYFGAGMGILMLAVLGMMGIDNIHQMNGLKNVLGMIINGVASIYFVATGLIDWPIAVLMSVGTVVGAYVSAGIAQRMSQIMVRRLVIFIGFAMAVSLLFRS